MNSQREDSDLTRVLESLMPQVEADFRVVAWKLLAKIGLLHLLASFATLSVCQQFGIKILGDFDLMHVFMFGGPILCQLLCGGFYFASSSFLVSTLLPRHEFVWMLRHSLVLGLFVVTSSMILLSVMGQSFGAMYMASWFLGATLGSVLVVSLLSRLRRGTFKLAFKTF